MESREIRVSKVVQDLVHPRSTPSKQIPERFYLSCSPHKAGRRNSEIPRRNGGVLPAAAKDVDDPIVQRRGGVAFSILFQPARKGSHGDTNPSCKVGICVCCVRDTIIGPDWEGYGPQWSSDIATSRLVEWSQGFGSETLCDLL